jgi:4-hydroxyacetophenone monooxygenase
MVWSHPSIRSSWYRNAEGRVTVLSSRRLVDYWSFTKAPDPGDFDFTRAAKEESR